MGFLEKTGKEIDRLREQIYAPGALDKKTRFLIALSNCVALECEPCTSWRFKIARDEFDCTQEEIEEAVSIAIMNRAGTTYAKSKHAWEKAQQESQA